MFNIWIDWRSMYMDLTKIRPFVRCSHFTYSMEGMTEERVPQCGTFFTGTHICIKSYYHIVHFICSLLTRTDDISFILFEILYNQRRYYYELTLYNKSFILYLGKVFILLRSEPKGKVYVLHPHLTVQSSGHSSDRRRRYGRG